MVQNTNMKTNWNDLFSLYKSLVGTFQEFEKQSYRKREIAWTAENAKNTIQFGFRRIIPGAFLYTLKGAIPFVIVFLFITNLVQVHGKKLIYHYEMFIEPVAYPFVNPFLKIGLLYAILVLLFVYVIFPCLIFLFPLVIVGTVFSRKHKISEAKMTLQACEKQLPQAEAAIQETWKKIAPHINKIPPNYRNSSALAFFSNSFFNYKVKNLQEAVNLYDQHLHQQRLEQNQKEIAEAQRESMEAINALSEQMDYMQDEISSLYSY